MRAIHLATMGLTLAMLEPVPRAVDAGPSAGSDDARGRATPSPHTTAAPAQAASWSAVHSYGRRVGNIAAQR